MCGGHLLDLEFPVGFLPYFGDYPALFLGEPLSLSATEELSSWVIGGNITFLPLFTQP